MTIIAFLALSVACGAEPTATNQPNGSSTELGAERQRLEAAMVAYRAQQQLFVDGDFPLATPPVMYDCPDDTDCDMALGYNIGGSFYAVWGEPSDLDLKVDGPVATVADGEVYIVAGAEPAIYLVLKTSTGWDVLLSHDAPRRTTSKDLALGLRHDHCSIEGLIDEVNLDRLCAEATVSWLVNEITPPWQVDDPFSLSNPWVYRSEPTPETLATVTASLAAGTPHDEIFESLQSVETTGPHATLETALDALLASWCTAENSLGCRVGSRIDTQTPTKAEYTVVSQRATPGPESRYETIYSQGAVEKIDDTGWWLTETGPLAVHQNGTSDTGRADADERMARCCDITSGEL